MIVTAWKLEGFVREKQLLPPSHGWICMENHSTVTGWKDLNHYFWRVRPKIYCSPNFYKVFQFLLTLFFQSESFSCCKKKLITWPSITKGLSDTYNWTVAWANHINCTQLNPPITEFIPITITTTIYPTKLEIFQNERICIISVSDSVIFPNFG